MTSIMAAIRGEICATRPTPRAVDAILVYRHAGRYIGMHRLAQLWQDYRGSTALGAGDPRGFATFLAQQVEGRTDVALADLARLDLALYLAGMADREPSVGACCLPADVIAGHGDLVLRLQPSFRYLALRFDVHDWQSGPMPSSPNAQPVWLRLSPGGQDARREVLPAAQFAFESSLARGFTLAASKTAALTHTNAFDEIAATLELVAAGAIADVMLHPKG